MVVADVAAHLDAQAGGRERPAVVDEAHAVRDDLERALAVDDLEVRHGQVAVQRERRGAVLEDAVVRPLEPQQPVGQHRDPPAVALHDGVGTGDRGRAETEVRIQGFPLQGSVGRTPGCGGAA